MEYPSRLPAAHRRHIGTLRGSRALGPFRRAVLLLRFYGDLLGGFQEEDMIPWRTHLSAQGFTWQRLAPVLFLSTEGASSTYHNDNSHGPVWQVHGIKTFHSYLDPDKHLSADAAVIGEPTGEEPPEHDAADRQSVTMRPGDQVWSHALTPHWVTTESALAMSVTLSHGGLSHQGHFSEREPALRACLGQEPRRGVDA